MPATDSAGFPTRPNANELIESAWGGAVRDRLIVKAGAGGWSDPSALGAAIVDLYTIAIAPQEVATRLHITTTWQARSQGAGGGLATADVFLLNGAGAALPPVGPWRLDADGSTWSGLAQTFEQPFAAGQVPSYKVRFTGSGGPGLYRVFSYSTFTLVLA